MEKALVYDKSALRQRILQFVGSRQKVEKRLIFEDCFRHFGLSAAEKKDKSFESRMIKAKSVIGALLSEMRRDGVLELVDEYYYKLPQDMTISDLITEDKIEEFCKEIFKDNKSLTKKEIFAKCVSHFDRDGDGKEREIIHRRGGNVLARLLRSGALYRENGRYFRNDGETFPDSDVGNCLKEAAEGADVRKCFKILLNMKGGEFFEEFSIGLISAEIAKTSFVVKSEVTGGADDNGIDGVIETEDGFGFRERVLVQARTRAKGAITLKEVREFFGAMISEKGTRGIFVTTASFHSEAQKFMNRQRNLIGIDGDKLFSMATENTCGVTVVNGKTELIPEKFL